MVVLDIPQKSLRSGYFPHEYLEDDNFPEDQNQVLQPPWFLSSHLLSKQGSFLAKKYCGFEKGLGNECKYAISPKGTC